MKFVTDTHAFVWYLQDSPRLSNVSKMLFDQQEATGQIVIPAIVLAELLYLSRKVPLPFSFKKLLRFLEREERFEIYPLSLAIIEEAIPLTQFDIHDSLIVASALYLKLPMMTQDKNIVDSGIIKILQP